MITQQDYWLPLEIIEKIFFEHADEDSRYSCSTVCKKINKVFFDRIFRELKLESVKQCSSYSQVMQYFKNYCQYFRNKLLTNVYCDPVKIALVFSEKTVLECKNQIDKILKLPSRIKQVNFYDRNGGEWETLEPAHKLSVINELWEELLRKNIIRKNSFFLGDYDKEAQLLLRAGADPMSSLHDIIKVEWCSAETMQMLFDRHVFVEAKDIYRAITYGRDKSLIDKLFSELKYADDYFIQFLMKKSNFDETILIDTVDKIEEISSKSICLALEKNFSEEFILKMIRKCKESLTPDLSNHFFSNCSR